MRRFLRVQPDNELARQGDPDYFKHSTLPRGVTVAQVILDHFVIVRIYARQPAAGWRTRVHDTAKGVTPRKAAAAANLCEAASWQMAWIWRPSCPLQRSVDCMICLRRQRVCNPAQQLHCPGVAGVKPPNPPTLTSTHKPILSPV